MSEEIRMTLLHRSTNDLIEELLMWRGRAAELLDRIAELEDMVDKLIEAGDAVCDAYPAYISPIGKWDSLVKDWKEREKNG